MKKLHINLLMFIFTIGVAQFLTYAISPVLTLPRAGDKLPVLKLKDSPGFCDSLSFCPVLTDIESDKTLKLHIWAPATSDTVSSMLITLDRDITTLIQHDDTLRQISKSHPGYIRNYDNLPLYGYCGKMFTHQDIQSSGETSNIGVFKTNGQYSYVIHKGVSLTTISGDTLYNVDCVQSDINESIIYSETDTTRYTSSLKKWFAPGFRYPLLTHEKGVLLSQTGDTLDIISKWYAIDDHAQIEQLSDDPINEDIRHQQATRKSINPSNKEHGIKNANKSVNLSNVHYDSSTNTVIINHPIYDSAYQSYILCDLAGIVYKSGVIPSDGCHIKTDDLHNGGYLLYISTSEDPVVYKFNINQR